MLTEIPVVFPSQGVPLLGTLFRNTDGLEERQPCVVISGSWLNVKEQMASNYARALARRGFTCFVFDFAGWGESGGALRQVEVPASKLQDIASAAAFVATLSFVEPGAVGYLGVCASAQYALRGLAAGAPIRSFVSVAGWFHDSASVAPFYGGASGVALRLGRAREAFERFRRDGTLVMAPAYEPGNDRAGMHFELDYYANPARGAIPGWKNQMAELSWLHWLAYDGLSPAAAVTTPTLLIHSDGCALPDNARSVHARLTGKKRLTWLDGTQTDYYDQPQQVDAALEHACAWFEETLR
jgi:dienelactone hydrolase